MCQGLLPSRRHIEKREDPGDEVEKFHYPRVSTGALPLTKKPVDSGYEIVSDSSPFSDLQSLAAIFLTMNYLDGKAEMMT